MKYLLSLVLLLTVAVAQAEIVFAPSASYVKQEDENAGVSVSELVMSTYDLKLGYVHSSGLYLGGMYQMSKLNDDKGSAAGPTVGFRHYSGFYTLFTYFLMAEQDTSATTKFTDGMGPQIDVGWVFPLTASFYIGPQVSYRSINYGKAEGGGASVDADYTRTNILPHISLWFRF